MHSGTVLTQTHCFFVFNLFCSIRCLSGKQFYLPVDISGRMSGSSSFESSPDSARIQNKSSKKTKDEIKKYEAKVLNLLQRSATWDNLNRFFETLFDYFYFLAKMIGAPENASGRLKEFLRLQWPLIEDEMSHPFLEDLGKEVDKLKTGPESAQKFTAMVLEEYVKASIDRKAEKKTTSVMEEGDHGSESPTPENIFASDGSGVSSETNNLDRFYDFLRDIDMEKTNVVIGRTRSGKTMLICMADLEANNRQDITVQIMQGSDYVLEMEKPLFNRNFPDKTREDRIEPISMRIGKDKKKYANIVLFDVAGELYARTDISLKAKLSQAKKFIILIDAARVLFENWNQPGSGGTLSLLALEYRSMLEKILQQQLGDANKSRIVKRRINEIREKEFLVLLTQWDKVKNISIDGERIFEVDSEQFVSRYLRMLYHVLTQYIDRERVSYGKVYVDSVEVKNDEGTVFRPVLNSDGYPEIVGMGEVINWLID